MLTQETKRKIDSARQILVGKVPDPKAQIDQITTALIYKFMDDMDKDAMELGGKARFFTNGFEKYAWSKILDPKLGGHERLELYGEAITKLWQNNHLPQLFRDIFKDAFLPYRSPETLSLFLKEINGFTYNHSEDLGDAFEYLLSIMSSQGDAGQFRTPRHIIDFIAEVVDPKKDESILDPACGTAGFLISAYKHILKQHDGKNDPEHKEKPLTPDDKKKLMNNLVGYDISPDMVKLSKVNMYLHGFAEPKIYEYDTLSSDEKWDEMYDVIMANPPFMSPKGGIRPHKRFSVQANRAEVLFVDYIKEHLRPNGRAGVIVPEGIIFKNDTAYKQLRRLLVEDGLFAVVSLPAGVFNPYSGVKTSILFFDNELAKRVEHILFVKIRNDGFDLGAQRRPIVYNDLPLAVEAMLKYQKHVRENGHLSIGGWPDNGGENIDTYPNLQFVSKKEILDSQDIGLINERYKTATVNKSQKWPMVELEEVLDYEQPTKYIVSSVNYNDEYPTPVLTAGKTFILGYTDEKNGIFPVSKLPVIIFDDFTTATKLVNFSFKVKSSAMKILHAKKDKADARFLFYLMQGIKFSSSTHKRYWISEYSKIKIPFPPLEVQKEIVEQIEAKQNTINHAKEIIKNLERERRYFGQELRKLEDVEWVEFSRYIKTITPPKKIQKSNFGNSGKYPIIDQSQEDISGWIDDDSAVVRIKRPVVIFGDHTCVVKYLDKPFVQGADGIKILQTDKKLLSKFLYYFLRTNPISSDGYKRHFLELKKIKIPLPSHEIQKQLVREAEKEEEIITSNRRLIELMEQKIEKVVNTI